MVDPQKPRDIGTPELSRRRKVLPRTQAGAGYNYDLYVVDGSEIDRLLLAGKIDTVQHSTLNSFTIKLHRANMLGPKAPALEKRSSSDPAWVAGKAAEEMATITRIIRSLDREIGDGPRRAIVDLCMMDKPPQGIDLAAAIAALSKALDG